MANLIVNKGKKSFTVSEFQDKWTVNLKSKKLLVSYDISKELCPTADELCEYIKNNNELF